jgi:hypothetical protein
MGVQQSHAALLSAAWLWIFTNISKTTLLMRTLVFFGLVIKICCFLTACKKNPDKTCWDTCPPPRVCLTDTCICTSDRVFVGNMCLRPNNHEYIAFLTESDGLDTFSLAVGPGIFSIKSQSNSSTSTSQQGVYISYPSVDSIFINDLAAPDGLNVWPRTLDGERFFFRFRGAVSKPSLDTIFAKIHWIGISTGIDLRPPVEFQMHLVR